MIYRFIDTEKAEFPVKLLCKVCKVSRSSYYYWDSMGRSSHECATEATEELKKTVYKAYVATRSLYGAPRLTKELSIYGVMISKSRTARIMASMGIHGACGRVKVFTTRRNKLAKMSDDLIKRNFFCSRYQQALVVVI